MDELVKREGWTSAAARLAREPEQIGDLRGKVGLFAGATAKAEREAALRVAEAIAPSLERIGAAEGAAERAYRSSVEGQRSGDAIGIPRLSAAAEVAIGALSVADGPGARAEAWRALQADSGVAGELRLFRAAVTQRYGEKGVRAMLRDGVPMATFTADRPAEERQVAAIVVTAGAGERAAVAELREAARMTQRHGPRR